MSFSSKLVDFLVSVRVVDRHDGTLSLSSTVLGATTVAAVANPSWIGVGAMAVAGLLYAHKRYTNASQSRHDAELKRLAESMAQTIQDLQESRRAHKDLDEKLSREINRGAFRK
jgi:hypothetical protein